MNSNILEFSLCSPISFLKVILLVLTHMGNNLLGSLKFYNWFYKSHKEQLLFIHINNDWFGIQHFMSTFWNILEHFNGKENTVRFCVEVLPKMLDFGYFVLVWWQTDKKNPLKQSCKDLQMRNLFLFPNGLTDLTEIWNQDFLGIMLENPFKSHQKKKKKKTIYKFLLCTSNFP